LVLTLIEAVNKDVEYQVKMAVGKVFWMRVLMAELPSKRSAGPGATWQTAERFKGIPRCDWYMPNDTAKVD